jgi:hypothetical protein
LFSGCVRARLLVVPSPTTTRIGALAPVTLEFSGAKAHINHSPPSARLKPCPDTFIYKMASSLGLVCAYQFVKLPLRNPKEVTQVSKQAQTMAGHGCNFGWLAAGIAGFFLGGAIIALHAHPTQPPSQATAPAAPQTAALKYKNIKVLKDIPADELIPSMQFITRRARCGVRLLPRHQPGKA